MAEALKGACAHFRFQLRHNEISLVTLRHSSLPRLPFAPSITLLEALPISPTPVLDLPRSPPDSPRYLAPSIHISPVPAHSKVTQIVTVTINTHVTIDLQP